MKRLVILACLFVLPMALVACGGGESAETTANSEAQHDHETSTDTRVVEARLEDGVQVADIEAGQMGYAPKAVALEANVPARLTFTRTVDSACLSQIQIPDFDVPVTDLPMNEPITVEFTPDEGGEFTFMCGMDMVRGGLMVKAS